MNAVYTSEYTNAWFVFWIQIVYRLIGTSFHVYKDNSLTGAANMPCTWPHSYALQLTYLMLAVTDTLTH
jgi:hypothetical protein